MTFEERSRLVDRIILGFSSVYHEDEEYIIHDPRPQDRYLADQYYDKVLEKLNYDGVLSKEQALLILKEKKIWSEEKEEDIKKAQDNIKILKKKLPALEFRSTEKRQILATIEKTEQYLSKLITAKNSLLTQSAEYISSIEKYKKLIFLLTFKNGKRLWEDWNFYNKIQDDKFINFIMNKVYLNTDVDEKAIRLIARTEPWRSIWISSCKVGNLFSVPMSNMTDYQKAVVSWSLIYDSVYESMDSPPQETIDNDILLDTWLEQQSEKRNSSKNNKSSINSKHEEVGIVVDTSEDAKRVHELNSSEVKANLRERSKVLQEKGQISEVLMPDTQRNLRLMINRKSTESIKAKNK